MYGIDHKNQKTWVGPNDETGKIIQPFHVDRIKGLIEDAERDRNTKVLIGGSAHCDRESQWVCPTVVEGMSQDCKLMQEEIFGPILPVMTFVNFQETISEHILKREKPLAIYYFGDKSGKNWNNLMENTNSGALVANDILF
jgi:acyl-CoA reductase-like NAD-dependent aldehyde dehydrogenase